MEKNNILTLFFFTAPVDGELSNKALLLTRRSECRPMFVDGRGAGTLRGALSSDAKSLLIAFNVRASLNWLSGEFDLYKLLLSFLLFFLILLLIISSRYNN